MNCKECKKSIPKFLENRGHCLSCMAKNYTDFSKPVIKKGEAEVIEEGNCVGVCAL